jgi:hypothetical protein
MVLGEEQRLKIQQGEENSASHPLAEPYGSHHLSAHIAEMMSANLFKALAPCSKRKIPKPLGSR